MSLIETAASLLKSQLGASNNIDLGVIQSALSGLMGDGDGGIDINSIISKLKGGGLATLAASWLGDGENAAISADQIIGIFGADKVDSFASQIGTSSEDATNGLSQMIPNLIDKSSTGGSLLDSVGGAGGLMGMAKKFF